MGNPYDIENDPIYQEELAKAYKEYGVGGPKPAKQNSGFGGDVGTGLKIGVEQLPGMTTGLADIAVAPISKMTGLNKPFSKGADWLGEQTGFQPAEWAKKAQSEYSPQYQEAKRNVDAAEGFWDTTGALLKNPRMIAGTVAESLPSTVAGMGAAGFGAKAALGAERFAALRTAAAAGDKAALGQLAKYGSIAGGIGEGTVTAGQQMSQLGDNVDPLVAAGTSLGAGAVTGTIGGVSGRLASKMGLSDIDSALVTGIGNKTGQAGLGGIAKRAAQGALTEGVIEELPQSMQEQIWQNVAEGKPWNEGVAKQGAMGMMAGMAMGAGINMAPRRESQPVETPQAEEKAPVNLLGHNPEIGTSWNNTYNNDPIIAEGSPSQVPLQQLDLLHLGDQMTEARELMHSDMSQRRQGALYETPTFDLNDQTLPLPTDPGSAVAVLQVLSHAQAQGQALVEGTPAYAALLEAQKILAGIGATGLANRFTLTPGVPEKLVSEKAPNASIKGGFEDTGVNHGTELFNYAADPVTGEVIKTPIAKGASNVVPQVAQGSNQAQGGNSVGSAGTVGLGNSATGQRDGLGRTAVAPAGPGGTTGVVGSTSGGVSAVTPESLRQQFAITSTAKPVTGLLEDIAQRIGNGSLTAEQVAPILQKTAAAKGNSKAREAAAQEYLALVTPKNTAAAMNQVAGLPPVQQKVYDHILAAVQDNRSDDVIGADGVFKATAIANALGIKKAGSVTAAISGMRKHLEHVFKNAPQRKVDAPDISNLGLSPAKQNSVVNENDLFGNAEAGAEQNMGIINSVGGSQGETEGAMSGQEQLTRQADAARARGAELPSNDDLLALVRQADRTKNDVAENSVQTAEEKAAEEQRAVAAKNNADLGSMEILLNSKHAVAAAADFEAIFNRPFTNLTLNEQAEFVQRYDELLGEHESFDAVEAALIKEFNDYGQVAASNGEAGLQDASGIPQLGSREGVEGTGSTVEAKPQPTVTTKKRRIAKPEEVSGKTQFSEGKTDQGIEPQKLAATLRKFFFSPEKFNKLVSIFPNAEAIPADVKTAAAADAHMSVNDVPWEEVQGFAMNGKVYLVASNIKEGNELGVFLHELGVHVGMERLIGKGNMSKLSSQIEQWAARDDKSQETKLAKDAVRRAEGSASKDRQQEVIAYFVEEAVKAGINPVAVQKINSPLAQWFRSLWAAAKLALRKIGFGRFDQLTAQNIVDLSYGAAKMELTGTWHGTAADFRNFNHSYMGSGEGAQAFGWGTYLAQRVGIAKGYWEADTDRKTEGPFVLDQAKTGWYVVNSRTGEVMTNDLNKLDAETALLLYENMSRPDGSLMRVDTAVHDDEMIDLDKSVTEQPKVVKDALAKVKDAIDPEFLDEELDRLNADWEELSGGELIMYSGQPGVLTRYAEAGGLYDQYLVELGDQRSDAKTKEAYSNGMLTLEDYAGKENFDRVNKMSPEVVVAQYLDSIGIKGIKFLDSMSRNGDPQTYRLTLDLETAKAQLRSAHESLEFYERYPDQTEKSEVEASIPVIQAEIDRLEAAIAKAPTPNLTRNLVIFNDKNIQRVASQVGANRDKVKFSQADVTDQAQRIAGETGKQLIDDTSHFLKKLGRSMEFLNDLVDRTKKVLPSAETWYSTFQKMQASKIQMERKAEEVASLADTLGAERYKVVNDFIGDSTFKQRWGFQPSWKQEKVTVDSAMAVRWAKLSVEEKALVEAVFKHGDEFIAQRDAIFKKLGVEDKMLTASRIQGPYAPLKRFGNYVSVLKSKELVAAEKLAATSPNAENNKRVDELKKDPDHFVSKQFDTIGQARKYSKANAADWTFTDSFESSTNVDDRTTMDYQVLQKVMGSLNATNLPATVRTEMENTIRDIYISSVDEHSARISGLKRKNRAGYDEDMLRSFLVNARANASFLSNLEHGAEMNDAFYKMQNETKDADGRRGGQDMFNSIAEHYKMNLHYEDTPVSDRITAFTSAWQLSSSLGYHLANASQGMMVSVPWLAAQFNDYRGAWRHLMGGYATMREIMKGKTGYDGIDLSKVKNPKLREALEHAYNMNLLDVGMQEDLSHFDRFRSGYSAIDSTSGAVSSVMHKLRRVASMVELWNRVSSATAAYNMAIENGKSHEQALAYVEGVLRKTQGDFTRADAPLLLKKLPKPTVQYRKYQFLMGAFYVSAFLKAFNGSTVEEKAIGKRMLGFKLFHTSMAAGLLGMPLMNLAALVFSALGGDDEPKDLEASLREAIGNKTMSDLLLHGPLASLGFDMSSKLGDDKIFSIAPYTNFDFTSAKGAANTIAGVAGGPALSQVGRMASGVGYIKDGELYKGVERLMPKGLESAMQSFRMANEGFTLKNGDVMVKPEDISAFALTLNAFGLPATEIKSMQWLSHHQQEIGQFYSDHSKALQHQYRDAFKEHDTEKMAELRQAWMDLQKGKGEMRQWFNGRPDELKRQPLTDLVAYPQKAAKREMKHQRSFDADTL